MAGEKKPLQGPDLREGIRLEAIAEGEPLLGHADGEAVVLVRRGDRVQAIGAKCTHYGGPLAKGIVVGDTLRCPWHHACFSLATGEAVAAPALKPVACWRVEVRDGMVRVGEKEKLEPLADLGRTAQGPASVVIVGFGAAGSAAAEMLRREGYEGPVTVVDPEGDAPYDRPNLSKDYLAGDAQESWLPLRPEGFYAKHRIERVSAEVASIDPANRRVVLEDGSALEYGALLLATGAEPVRLEVPGAELPHVRVLRSLADCRSIIAAAEGKHRVAIVGASFIGMEVAAALRGRGLEVTVIAPDALPFERTLGRELGELLKARHEERGVRFRLGRRPAGIGEGKVRLDDGSAVEAELVVVGIGVRPRLRLAEEAGLALDRGVLVDEYLETSAPGVFAAGDIARWPDRRSGERMRVEHWVVAQRQGQAAARNILGRREPFVDVPFFWTRQYDLAVDYVGHATKWDRVEVDGDLAKGDCTIRYREDGRTLAVATVGRDRESLLAEAEMEREGAG